MNEEYIRKLPKIELHCHLDGSISLEMLNRLAGKIVDEASVQAPVPCGSLKQYLQCFSVVLPLLQTKEALRLAAWDVVRQAAEEHVIYIEVRFAPAFHCEQGLTEMDACRAVVQGLQKGEEDFGVQSRAIVCMMRGLSAEQNERTLHCADQLRDQGIAGLDLAGDEAAYPTELYRSLFEKARDLGLLFTIHAGECGSAKNVNDAIALGARRIGHGVAAAGHEEILNLCREKNICFEMCPVSNLQTKAVTDLQDYPFLPMQKAGLAVTIHTDNRTVSGTTLTKEWMTLLKAFPEITEDNIRKANLAAAQAAFLPEKDKSRLIQRLSSK